MKRLYLLPFDHRSSFLRIIKAKDPPTKKDIQKARECKKIIYEAFKKSLFQVPKKDTAILVDEWLGRPILQDAKKRKIITCSTFEKSGQKEFQFERKDWKKQLKEIKPDYAKVLIRYDPKGDKQLNLRQAKKLAGFSNYLKTRGEQSFPVSRKQRDSEGISSSRNAKHFSESLISVKTKTKFLLEIITPDQNPRQILKAIKQLQKKGIYPDVWKLEGVNKIKDMKKISKQIKSRILILGRGENKKKIGHWFKVAAKFDNVIGFAIGRTIFARPLRDFHAKKLTRKQTINKISRNYIYFVKLFEKYKQW